MANEITFNKENIFYKNRMRIKEISQKEHCDAGIASSMFASEAKINNPAAMNEWMEIMKKYQRHKTLTLADLFK